MRQRAAPHSCLLQHILPPHASLNVFGELSAGCVASFDFFDVLFWTCVIPLTVAGIFVLALLAGVAQAGKDKKKRTRQKHLWVSLLFLLSYVTYPGASIAIFTIFPCDEIEGVRYLKADYSLRCDEAEYDKWKSFASFMAIVYPFGIPAMYALLLRRDHKKIDPPEGKDTEDKLKRRAKNHGEIKMISFLWIAYRPECWWFVRERRNAERNGRYCFCPVILGGQRCGCEHTPVALPATKPPSFPRSPLAKV